MLNAEGDDQESQGTLSGSPWRGMNRRDGSGPTKPGCVNFASLVMPRRDLRCSDGMAGQVKGLFLLAVAKLPRIC